MRAIAIPLVMLVAACQQAPEGRTPVTEAEWKFIVKRLDG